MQFDLPQGRMLPIERAELAYDAGPHPFETANAAAIEANWQAELAANPALFDGKVMLFSRLNWAQGQLDARCHAIRFATFLYWRRNRPVASAQHLYAHAMPVSSDGALIAIRMSPKTANPNRVYFAAGSFDMSDVRDGRIDVGSNMEREVMEETGMDLAGCRRDSIFHGWSSEAGTVILRRYFLDRPAEAIADDIRAFIEADPDPEITEAIVILDGNDLPEGLMPHVTPMVRWHFENA